ncbi:MAG: alanine racemase, partial [Gammaproteobacteria bacterium]
ADEIDNHFTEKQILCFNELTKHLPGPKTLANSAGILAWPQTHADWVRPGIMLYGISPFANKTGPEFNLKPVMTLQSELISVKTIKAGEIVGYTGRWICPEDMPIGIVACGYADGYPQMTADNTPVLVNQKPASIVGRVSMDMLAVDLRQCPGAKIGDPVILWGKSLPVEIVAKAANMSPYQVVCNISKRVKVIFEN